MSHDDGIEPVKVLLLEWTLRVRLALFTYNRAASNCRTWDSLIGGTATILTAAVGTTLFATLKNDVNTTARITVGAVSILAAILSALGVFAALPKRIEQYEAAARRFGAVRREIEQTLAQISTNVTVDMDRLDELREGLNLAAESSPNAPRRIWNRTRRHIKGDYTWWERAIRKVAGRHSPRPLGGPADLSSGEGGH